MKKFSLYHPLILSFYSKPLYQQVGRNWPGTGLLYLLLLVALAWAVRMIPGHFSIGKFAEEHGRALVAQVPSISIQDGQVSTNVPTPHFIRDPQKGTVLAIIDLTGEYTSLERSEAAILLTKDKLFFKKDVRETRMYDLAQVRSFAFSRPDAERWLEWGKKWLALLLYPIVVLGAFAYRAVQALIYALIGMLFAKSLQVTLDYQALLRLAVVAVTPAVLLDTVRNLAGWSIPFWWLICFGLAMGYLYYGVKANAETARADATATAPASPPPVS